MTLVVAQITTWCQVCCCYKSTDLSGTVLWAIVWLYCTRPRSWCELIFPADSQDLFRLAWAVSPHVREWGTIKEQQSPCIWASLMNKQCLPTHWVYSRMTVCAVIIWTMSVCDLQGLGAKFAFLAWCIMHMLPPGGTRCPQTVISLNLSIWTTTYVEVSSQ